MKEIRKKILYLVIAICAAIVTTVYAFKIGLNPPMGFLFGCGGAFLAAAIVSILLKIPNWLYILTLVFVYMASPLGSIMNFYRTIGPYDKIVHFFSGILIGAFGYFIVTKLLPGTDKKIRLVVAMFTFLFASGGAGLWEIFEFTTDILAGGGMQRGMVDTVTDMIAGNLGGILAGFYVYFKK